MRGIDGHRTERQAQLRALAGDLPLRRLLLQQALPLAALVGLILALSGRARALDPQALWLAVASVAAPGWIGAVSAAAISFLAVARYDRMAHGLIGTDVAPERAGAAGAAAIAVGQTLGFGLITGTLVRWRMLPELGLRGALGVSTLASALFLAGWALVAAPVWLLLGPEPEIATVPGGDLAALAVAGAGLAWFAAAVAGLRPFGRALPPPLTALRLVAVAAVDLGGAMLALWFCLPAGLGPEVVPAMLLAFGAGLVSGTPAGLGAFEAVFLSLLPDQPAEPLIGAVLAWRAVYFALPAVLGAAAALVAPGSAARGAATLTLHGTGRVPAPAADAPAEILLARQGEHRVAECRRSGRQWLLAETRHCTVALFDASPATFAALAAPLADRARARGRVPALYRIGPRAAVQARAMGWRLLYIGAEAVIEPARFDLSSPAQSGLRRKISRARRAGVTVERLVPGAALPLDGMETVARAWAGARGGERGFSTGRYCPDYVAGQQVLIARLGDRVAGFATFHAGPGEWTLDLMRGGADLPDGAMQALVVAAIEAARAEGVGRLSLAATSAASDPAAPGPVWRLARRAGLGRETAGLAQFKRAFAPHWEPRYLAAPGHAALALAALEVARAVHRPAPLPRRPGTIA